MKVFVIGATGMAGSAFVKKAVEKNIEVIANGRSLEKLKQLKKKFPQIRILAKNSFDLQKNDFSDSDAILNAFATAPSEAYLQTDLAAKLVGLFRENKNVRLGFILGAGSLLTGNDQHLALKDIEKDESTLAWRATPQNQYKELKFLRDVDNVDWFGVSPGLNFVPGKGATNILYGEDNLLFSNNGKSETTSETMAIALVKEFLLPQHHQKRFTVVNN